MTVNYCRRNHKPLTEGRSLRMWRPAGPAAPWPDVYCNLHHDAAASLLQMRRHVACLYIKTLKWKCDRSPRQSWDAGLKRFSKSEVVKQDSPKHDQRFGTGTNPHHLLHHTRVIHFANLPQVVFLFLTGLNIIYILNYSPWSTTFLYQEWRREVEIKWRLTQNTLKNRRKRSRKKLLRVVNGNCCWTFRAGQHFQTNSDIGTLWEKCR